MHAKNQSLSRGTIVSRHQVTRGGAESRQLCLLYWRETSHWQILRLSNLN